MVSVSVTPGGKGKNTIIKGTHTGAFKAGITFSTGRTHSLLKKGRYAPRIGKTAAVFLAAVLEYLVAEVGEVAGTAAHQNKRRTISSRYIQLSISQDEELHRLTSNVVIKGGGVVPYVHPELLPKSSKPHKKKRKVVRGADDD
ncbi:hypothetical protein JCM9279_003553 [Rhodotorula babjevae]